MQGGIPAATALCAASFWTRKSKGGGGYQVGTKLSTLLKSTSFSRIFRLEREPIVWQGYKMLATNCGVCYTIELQDKQGQIYCVACQEVKISAYLLSLPILSDLKNTLLCSLLHYITEPIAVLSVCLRNW